MAGDITDIVSDTIDHNTPWPGLIVSLEIVFWATAARASLTVSL